MEKEQPKMAFYAAIVWIISGLALTIYCILGFLNATIPGVEQLVAFLSQVDTTHIYLAACLAIFIEGLYFVGSFFPGSTLVVVVATLSQIAGVGVFINTMLFIFISWCVAGAVNILVAKIYHVKVAKLSEDALYEVRDRILTTWFPAFRANYEVAQVTEGGNPVRVFMSSVRVKFLATLAVAAGALVLPLFIDIRTVSNEEGFSSVVVVALISFTVGGVKLKRYFESTRS